MNSNIRILHAGWPFSYLPLLREEQRRRGFVSDIAISYHRFDIKPDYYIGSRIGMRDAKLFKIGMKYNIIHNHSPHISQISMLLLEKIGKQVINHYHGSDLRLFKLYEPNFCIVSTPDLLDHAPKGVWLPNSVDIEAFKPEKVSPNEIPVLLHYDYYFYHDYYSKRHYVTETYQRACEKLQERGVKFTMIKIHNIPYAKMPSVINKSDIIIDKIDQELGWYGNFSIEAMACEKPVVAYIRQDLYEKYKPPIYLANVENLADKLQILIEDEALRKKLGEQSRQYIQRVHNVSTVVNKLIHIYLHARKKGD